MPAASGPIPRSRRSGTARRPLSATPRRRRACNSSLPFPASEGKRSRLPGIRRKTASGVRIVEQRLSWKLAAWKLAFGKLAFGKLAFGKLAAGVLAALLVLAALPAAAASQSPTRSIEAMRERINAGTVGIVSGGLNGTYIRIAAELAAVLDDGDTLRVLPLVGKGSVQNIADILFLKGIDIGIVQSDVLAYIKRERLYPGADKSIQYIAKLYNEEFHILAGKDIARVEDLAGKKVNFDVANSGTAMTASLIFERLKTTVEPVHDD